MIHTIRWMVSREPSSQQKRVAERILPLFLLGGLVGGAVAGVVTAFFARILLGAAGGHLLFFALASSVVAVAYMGRVVGLWNIPKISFKHQVPEAWRNMFRPQTASLIYSTALGFTFPTRISSYAVYPLVVLLLGLGQWPWIVVSIFAVMGLTRAATALGPYSRLESSLCRIGRNGADSPISYKHVRSPDCSRHDGGQSTGLGAGHPRSRVGSAVRGWGEEKEEDLNENSGRYARRRASSSGRNVCLSSYSVGRRCIRWDPGNLPGGCPGHLWSLGFMA